jgi:hypothetical protein
MITLFIHLSLEQVECSADDVQNYNFQKHGITFKGYTHGQNSDVDISHNVFYNIYSSTVGAAIHFDACSGLFCFDKDLRVRDSLFVKCGSNGGNGGAVYFNGDVVIMERDAIFDCEAIRKNYGISGSFGYFNIDDDSTFNQITAVRTSPDKANVHYVNELSGYGHYSVFNLYMDPEDPYYCHRINETDCYGSG